ncbi:hypothetical protein BV25DRAFT_1639341 [Artomyces pyxidatus]|uniref:Uncharacterized protein n=1 Tax=Artomyces pyxidatus TaxID=48021 RepID=A0ACB8SIE6_9AGAM|nr:hypothetical protein BV25DRAFT_1639341 [Artomyces pyxidatus]
MSSLLPLVSTCIVDSCGLCECAAPALYISWVPTLVLGALSKASCCKRLNSGDIVISSLQTHVYAPPASTLVPCGDAASRAMSLLGLMHYRPRLHIKTSAVLVVILYIYRQGSWSMECNRRRYTSSPLKSKSRPSFSGDAKRQTATIIEAHARGAGAIQRRFFQVSCERRLAEVLRIACTILHSTPCLARRRLRR